jgi:hypothetical protein
LQLLWHQIYEHTEQKKLSAHRYLLLAVANNRECLKGIEGPLHLLWEAAYKVSQKKAQDLSGPPKASGTLAQ